MKKVCLLFLVLSLLLTSCRQDTTLLAKDEFSKYHNGRDEVVLKIDGYLHFENYSLNLDDLVEDNEYNLGLVFLQDRFIFSTSVENFPFDFTLNIYESDLRGTNIKLLFSKDGFSTHPWVYANGDDFYIEHYSKNALVAESKLIDRYTLSTGVYENVDSGKDCDLSDYHRKEEKSRYSFEVVENTSPQQHGKFLITDLKTGVSREIDDSYLMNTECFESMKRFGYWPKRYDVSNGHILLTYGISAGDGWTYPHLVFEYDFNSDTLEYKLLAFPYDNLGVKIVYIE